jgi:hypothetical protein
MAPVNRCLLSVINVAVANFRNVVVSRQAAFRTKVRKADVQKAYTGKGGSR